MNFLRKIVPLLAALVLSSLAALPAIAAEPHLYEGIWRQVKSNAGVCAKCSITIRRNGDTLEVSANNGWSATVMAVPKRLAIELPLFQGSGIWRNGQSKDLPLKAMLVYDSGQLQLGLIIREKNRTRTIVATFQR